MEIISLPFALPVKQFVTNIFTEFGINFTSFCQLDIAFLYAVIMHNHISFSVQFHPNPIIDDWNECKTQEIMRNKSLPLKCFKVKHSNLSFLENELLDFPISNPQRQFCLEH